MFVKQPQPHAVYLGNGLWLITPPNSIRLTIACQPTVDTTPTVHDLHIPRQHIVTLQSGCQAHRHSFILPTFYYHDSAMDLTPLLHTLSYLYYGSNYLARFIPTMPHTNR